MSARSLLSNGVKRYLTSLVDAAIQDYERIFLGLAGWNPGALLLDVGCDTGEWTSRVGESMGSGEIYGVDIVHSRIAEASRRGINSVMADLNGKLPFKDGSFGCVMSNQVIEHVHDLDNFVIETHRVLRTGGTTICCTENLSSWHNVSALVMGFQPFSLSNVSCKAVIGNPFGLHHESAKGKEMIDLKSFQHVRVLSWLGLSDIFSVHGFKIEEIRGTGYYPLPPIMAKAMARVDARHAAFIMIKAKKL